MREFVWVLKETAKAIHDEQMASHGGIVGTRDEGLLESALMRPQNLVQYENCEDMHQLAAAYASGICQNHPFLDGNKRTALVVAEQFLALNGYFLAATDGECVITILSLAAGDLSTEDLTAWFKANIRPA